MNAAIQKCETIAFRRGGRLSGFLDAKRTPFYLTKRLMDVPHIDEDGRAVRVPQWIIDLEAPVDVTALLRETDDEETAIINAQLATQVIQGDTVIGASRGDRSTFDVEGETARRINQEKGDAIAAATVVDRGGSA